jgi:hypothetical protein
MIFSNGLETNGSIYGMRRMGKGFCGYLRRRLRVAEFGRFQQMVYFCRDLGENQSLVPPYISRQKVFILQGEVL